MLFGRREGFKAMSAKVIVLPKREGFNAMNAKVIVVPKRDFNLKLKLVSNDDW